MAGSKSFSVATRKNVRQAHDLPIYSVGEGGRPAKLPDTLNTDVVAIPIPAIQPSLSNLTPSPFLPVINDRPMDPHVTGNVSVAELRSLLRDLSKGEAFPPSGASGGGAGRQAYIVITDVREELVLYINGVPYLRCGV